MTEMSMLETLHLWNEGVTAMDKGDYESTLAYFESLKGRTDSSQMLITAARNLFNIGKAYLNLGMLPEATEAFEQALDKDKMLSVAHFMLGCANLCSESNGKAVKNFDDAIYYLRGNKLIDYKQLGLKYKLYDCEILTNRAIAYARLGEIDNARDDFLQALQSKAEPRHSVIDDALFNWKSGMFIQHIELPANAVFRPAKDKINAMKSKPDFLGKAKVLVGTASIRKPPPPRAKPPKSIEITKQLENTSAKSARDSLLTDLRKKETRRSLKKSETRGPPPSKPLPVLPGSPAANARSQSLQPRSPRALRSFEVPTPHGLPKAMSLDTGLQPPTKPLPPSPRSKSPALDGRRTPEADTNVTFQLVITRTVKVSGKSSTRELSRAAAAALDVPEDSFELWYSKNEVLTSLKDRDCPAVLQATPGTETTIYCYEK